MGWLDALTGKSQQRAYDRAKATSDAQLDSGYDTAQGYYDKAGAGYDDYTSGGRAGWSTYLDLLGLNGADAAKVALAKYQSNPYLEQEENRLLNLMDMRGNARGQLFSGANAAAASRASAGLRYQDYDKWRGLIGDVGQTGLKAVGAQSGLTKDMGDLAYGHAQQKAGNTISYGNVTAQNKGTLVNNLLNLAGTAAKAYAASDVRLKRDIEPIGTLDSGLPYYGFKYLWSDTPHIGVLAHEAAEVFPDAVAVDPDSGFLMVDYARIG